MSLQLDNTQIIKRPLITEKTTWQGGTLNRYTFEVHLDADKDQIAQAVADIYKVRVLGVTTQIRKGKNIRTRFGASKKSDWKKASIQVHEEDKINII
jgi:large subunit ribosomal protein L23